MIPRHYIKNKLNNNLQISLIDSVKFAKAHLAFGNHRHSFYEMLLIRNGSGIHQIDFSDYEIKPNSFCFLSPGQVHNLSKATIEKSFVLIFDGDFVLKRDDVNVLRSLDLIFNQFPILYLEYSETEQINQTIGIIEIELRKQSPSNNIQYFALNLLLFQILQSCNQKNITTNKSTNIWGKRYFDFLELIEIHFATQHGVTFYADLLNIHPKRLNEASKMITGENAQFIVHKRLLTEAKRLLFYSNLTTKEIAFQLGFEDVSYFSKWFQKHMGMRPTTFQESNPETTT